MKIKLTKIVTVLTVVGLMGVGPAAYAVSEGDNPKSGKGAQCAAGKEFMKELNLTPDQKAKLEAQCAAKKESRKAVREQLKTKMQELHAAIAKPGATRADVNGLVGEVNALKGQLFSEKIDGLFAMKEVLTPEQFAKMEAKHQERMNKKHEGWGKKSQEPDQN